MRLADKTLRRLIVKTVSGQVLGRVRGFEIEVDDQMITQYTIISSLLRSRQYLVSRAQVRSITMTEMIVDDAIGRQAKGVSRRFFTIKTEPAVTSGSARTVKN
ncbi:MAG: hypothetical protein A2821_04455 [Candidatus Magasanikbacteria bacterium RIFCSPHIGHO2_01_FULL_41_23]|uniref:PRC-barrel domain-containing protein n=1 Tax=Candidatus Magasanikbacteria bacterium RIFCSPLOWO2_01_FULL_40_15 TaxID=1798686 RepID=A0A1F6N4B5_9BACT|nr:MAG: hypothetical protein A2821_04455 [Candidatus Magasanikbacteria bacterium RIFCSPHIGHO2_01_FULL_41_23]OGH67177.1 MAG: hypothetical protein A3C66_02770 [Candidatus Magasanikbacteria bacterium RIFCSPHIGHO2_02_FULL_41_35]OGH75458.1 MAG: hypothetical protein A3F22_01375 [Candidatus Magasanikbacteria bacterium RIFCSPHIGHO2_12_FULL_41_16]OGH78714.1 MAG: hypothetical protein A2983_04410 [Candidatus Magasanikbacteria bacterium RIFCSPLOWO2_01_FULL_40_15]